MAGQEWLEGGITAVPGILASGIHCGIKASGKKDLALIYSSSPARAAAVFTTNQVKGAPVQVSMEHMKEGTIQAIVASSGCSNVCTGEQGLRDAREMTASVGELLKIPARHVLVASTGVIGRPLPMDKIRAGLPKLVKSLSPQGGRSAAEGIMTTDTRPKEAALRVEVGGRPVTVGGIAKGVGMIEPHLATMFCFMATDAVVARDALAAALRRAVAGSFNRITVDGDMSTSDTVAILANGLAENQVLERGSRGPRQFTRGLQALTEKLAKLLVKTAINGQDPNWGRIMMALGKSAAAVRAERVSIAFDDEIVVAGGQLRQGARLDRVREIMARPEFAIRIDLGLGRGEDQVWTCDLSEEYVRVNAKYTT